IAPSLFRAARAYGKRMVAGVAGIAIAFDPDDHLRVSPEPIGLRGEDGPGGHGQPDVFCSKIDGCPARLRGKVCAQRINSLQDRLLLLLRPSLSQTRQLRLCSGVERQQRVQDQTLAHQSITPDQSGSDPSCGMVNGLGSLPSSAIRANVERPVGPMRWKAIS